MGRMLQQCSGCRGESQVCTCHNVTCQHACQTKQIQFPAVGPFSLRYFCNIRNNCAVFKLLALFPHGIFVTSVTGGEGYREWCTLHIAHCYANRTIHVAHCTSFIAHFIRTLHIVIAHSTLHIEHCTALNAHCTSHISHCTMHVTRHTFY